MSIFDRLFSQPNRPDPAPSAVVQTEVATRSGNPRTGFKGHSERSIPLELGFDIGHFVTPLGPKGIVHPPAILHYWRDYGYDINAIGKASPSKLLQIMADISPDLSRAISDFLRFSIPGWEITVTKNSSSKAPYKRGQDALNEILDVLSVQHGTLEVMFGKLFMAAFIRGAFFSELVLHKDKRTTVGLVCPDPALVRFRRKNDDLFTTEFELGQVSKDNKFVSLDRETVIYIPVEPFPGNPYGRAPAHPAIFSLLFIISMMNDIKRVIAQQGYPRLDIEIDLPSLAAMMTEDALQDPAVFNRWVAAAVSDIKDTYSRLQPDDAFIHTSMVKVNSNVGVLDVNSLGMVSSIIERLESMAMKALKSMPLLMGSTEGMSEASANRQWEVYVAGIESFQHGCENMLQRQFKLALQARGIAASVTVRFAQLRTAELLRDEMKNQLVIQNATQKYYLGAVDHQTMVFEITGKEPPPGVTEPLFTPREFVDPTAANAIKAEAASEGSAAPGQEGGDNAPKK